MTVQSLSVEGGFLDGLDLRLGAGLNVLIGERGTGKTSVVELLRYVLSAGSLVEGADTMHEERARSVLGDGVVHVQVDTPDGVVTVSRTHRDNSPRTTRPFPSFTVVGQGEMEAIGLGAASRLRLLDRYAGQAVDAEASQAEASLSTIRSLMEQMSQVRKDLRRVHEELEPLASVPDELAGAVQAQQAGLESVNATKEEAEQLSGLQAAVERLRHSISQVEESRAIATANHEAVNHAVTHWRALHLPDLSGAEAELALEAESSVEKAWTALTEVFELAEVATEWLSKLRASLEDRLAELDRLTRELRNHLEHLKEGLSAAARTVERLRERAGTRSALLARQGQLLQEARSIADSRRALYADIDAVREKRRNRRKTVATRLTDQYGPQVRVAVTGGADRSRFTNAIIEALTGSGLHYNTLAPLIAESMTPLELVEAAERLDGTQIANPAGIPESRAAQVALQLANRDLTPLAISPIDDAVSLELLDGAEYKKMKALSIGQRCTVVLPLVLGALTSGLVLDQPEDNLDNAFLATTIVPGIVSRAKTSQVIIATHNPNIPVLGDANLVAHMGSDGSRGYVISCESMTDPGTRRAITEIMEGGKEAFKKRAQFYGVIGQ